METTNRMDGLSRKVAKVFLKLIGMSLEGKVRTKYLLRINDFLEENKA